MTFHQLRQSTAAISTHGDRHERHDLIGEQSRRIERHYGSGDISFPEWARLMAILLVQRNRTGAVALS